MGYSLECYALGHGVLDALVGSGRREVVQAVVQDEARLFVSSPGVPWRDALRDLVAGVRGRMLADAAAQRPGTAARATDREEAAMTALIRHQGRRVGELIHNSGAGAKFRAMFDPGFTPAQFVGPGLAPLLLGRPLGHLYADDYPRWGGLTNAELVQALGGHSTLAARPADDDHHVWFYALFEMMAEVRDSGEDLVTLYL